MREKSLFDLLTFHESGTWSHYKVIGFNSGEEAVITNFDDLEDLFDPKHMIDFEGRELRGQALPWKPALSLGDCPVDGHKECEAEGMYDCLKIPWNGFEIGSDS